MEHPLVSVILPAYNHEKYVAKALDSIVQQDYENKELLIINDGSSDNTHEVISNWIDNHKHILPINYVNRENRGISATLNELISRANGKYIAGMSSDDYLLERSLSLRVEHLLAHPDKNAVFGNYIVIDENGRLIHPNGIKELYKGNTNKFSAPEGLKFEMLRNFSIAGPVLMFERNIFNIIGTYDESLKIEDWDIYLRMAGLEVLGFIDKPMAAYRWYDLNTCKNIPKSPKTYKYERKILEKNRPFFSGASRKHLNQLIRRRKRKEFDYVVRTIFKTLFSMFKKQSPHNSSTPAIKSNK